MSENLAMAQHTGRISQYSGDEVAVRIWALASQGTQISGDPCQARAQRCSVKQIKSLETSCIVSTGQARARASAVADRSLDYG
jgi:hypothetical protein